jgi:hypothetical protein
MDGNVCLGTAPLVAGQASLTNSLFIPGTQVITASYNGSAVGLALSTAAGQDLSVTSDTNASAAAASFAMPCYVSSAGANSSPQSSAGPTGMTPTQIRQAYGFNSVSFGTQAADGTGTTIAIVDAYDDPSIASDLSAFDSQFGIAAPPSFTKVNQTGGTTYPAANAGWITEIALDVEWSHAVAPGANILLVEANSNSNNDLYTAVDYARHAAGVVAVSMSWGGGESSGETSTDSYFTTPSGHAGVTFLASSGDTGAPPIYPSISPNVVSVGGTSLYLTAQNAYSSESGWSGSGGGISSYESQPAYQKGVVTQSTTYRTDPDVSYDANPSTGFPVYDSYNNGTATPWGQWGGTSDAAPQWAALVAIVDQGRALNGVSSLDGATQTLPLLYTAAASDFHDITSGTSTGSPNYSAGAGYDLVTGRGTPYANQIIPYLVGSQAALPTSTSLGVSAGTITYGQSVTLTATVTVVPPGTGTPNGGTVTFLDDGTAIGSAALSGGTASFTTSTLSYGVQQLTASYSGFGTSFCPSSSPTGGLSSASIVTTVAGGSIGDGNQATAAALAAPYCMAMDSAGDLFIADTSDNRIREVNHTTGVITTVAGTGIAGYSGDGGQATAAELNSPYAVAVDSSGNLYIADRSNERIREVNLATGVITTIAGTGSIGHSGDGGQATAAQFYYPEGLALDGFGDLFIADYYNDRVRELNLSTGVITTAAGTGTAGYNGDGIAATAAELDDPVGLAVDSVGNFYIADSGNSRVRNVNVSSGLITTVAGNGSVGYNGDGEAATAAVLYFPLGVAVDGSGNIFIADDNNNRVREVYASNATIATVAGTGASGCSGDGAAATAAKLAKPTGVTLDSSGNLYIADFTNNRIRAVNSSGLISTFAGGCVGDGSAATAATLMAPYGSAVDSAGDIFIADTSDNRVREISHATGLISTVAGTGIAGYNGTNIQATAATLNSPRGVALDSAGNLYIADSGNNRIREINLSTGIIITIAGNGTAGCTGDGGAATAAEISDPYALTLDGSGDLFIADYGNQRIRELRLSTGVITTVAGGGVGDGQPATTAPVYFPQGVAVDSSGNIYIADTDNDRVREVNHATGLISTVAGTGIGGYNGDNIQATAAELYMPYGVAVDSSGNLYIADYYNSRIRKVNLSTGVITTVAGTGTWGYSGDTGQATAAELDDPRGVALDGNGDLFIADSYNNRVREVKLFTGIIITVAGTGTGGYNGDGIQAAAAELCEPGGVAVDSAGNLYIADTEDYRIREVFASSGLIATVAGNGTAGYSGDNGAATAAELLYPEAVAVDASGDLLIADTDNCRIREVYAASGTIATVAGSGTSGFAGDGGAATAARLTFPGGVAVDASGNLYIADSNNLRVREVIAATGLISTVAGNGSSNYGGDGGAATAADLNRPTGVAVDSAGNLYIADSDNERVRRVNLASGIINTVAGDASFGYSGDGGPATAAALFYPEGVALDSSGNLFIADSSNNRVREVNLSTGIITTLAGSSSTAGFSGDGGPASAALLHSPTSIATDSSGDLYIVDSGNNRVRELAFAGTSLVVDPAASSSTSIAVSSPAATTYGGSVPLSATLLCGGIAVSGETVTFTLNGSFLALAVTGAGGVASISAASVAGIAPGTYCGDLNASFAGNSWFGISAAAGNLTITTAPLTIAVDNTSKVYGAADPAFSATYTGFVSGQGPANLGGTLLFSTNEPASGFAPAGCYAISPSGLSSGDYAITFIPGTLAVIPATTSTTLGASTTSSVYGQSITLTATVTAAAPSAATPTGGTATFMDGGTTLGTVALNGGTASFLTTALAAGKHGLWVIYNGDGADFSASSTTSLVGAIITTAAGNGTAGYSGNGGAATAAELFSPYAVAADAKGDFFIADASNNRIREVSAAGIITTVAGNGTAGYAGDGGQATAAELSGPYGVFVDAGGHLFIADAGNNRIREVNLSTGVITAIAGGGTSLGDGGQATAAELADPYGAIEDSSGHLFISDFDDQRIREVSLATGIISTIAGNGDVGYAGDGGQATAAEINCPEGLALDANGNLYIADQGNARVRKVNLASGVITTVAGNGTYGYSGDGGQATAAEISYPRCVAIDSAGNLYISDTNNARIRAVNLSSGLITTIAGNGTAGYAGDGGQATAAELDYPRGIAVDSSGRLLIADTFGNRIRVLAPAALSLTLTVSPAPLTVTASNQSKVYGAANPGFTVNYTGFVNGDTQSVLSGNVSLATTATVASGVGNYTITAAGTLAAANYRFNYINGLLTVTPAPLTVTANNQSKVYGGTDPSLTYTPSGTLYNGDPYSVISGVTLSTTTGSAATVGTQTITITGGTAANYTITDVPGTLTVSPASLTVTADNQSKVYGGTDPSLTYTPSGTLYYGDSYSVIGGVTLATATGSAATVGTYAITASGGTAANYTITDVPGTFTVIPASLTVTADNQSKVYGGTDPSLTYTPSGTLYYGDSYSVIGGVTLSTTTGSAATVGTYAITASGGTAANYTITDDPGTLTVTPASLTVTADNQSKVYGGTDPSLTYTPSGTLYYGDSYSVISGVTLSTATGSAATAGTQTITIAGGTAANYTITDVPGTLTVSPASLTVAADNQSKVYGGTDPVLTYTPSGTLYYGDSYSVISGVVLATASGSAATVGTYAITATGGTAANYTITDVPGTLTVSPASLTVTADNQSKVYGGIDPSLTYTPRGTLYYGDSYSVISGVTLSTATGSAATVGSYVITATGGTAANYTITDDPGTLTVSPASLTVTADNQSKVYGGTDPVLTYTPRGTLYYGDSYSVISGVSLATATGSAATAGTHTITITGGTAANYTITCVRGTLSVSQATPVVDVYDAGGICNGSAFPATATAVGISGVPTASLEGVSPTLTYYVGGTAGGSGSSAAPSAVGTYTVVASFTGSSDFMAAQSNPLTFTIASQLATPGLYDPTSSWWYLRNSNATGGANIMAGYGPPGGNWIPLSGDWTGSGTDTIGLYNPATGFFYLHNSNTTGVGDITFFYGDPGQHWIPVVGDWTGQKSSAGYPIDSVGLYDPKTCTWYLRNSLTTGVADITIGYGPPGAGWLPLVGDWDGNGTTTVGLYNPATGYFYLRNSNTTGVGNIAFFYGDPTQNWTPVAGDWSGDGRDSIGMYDPKTCTWYLRNELSTGVADMQFSFGSPSSGWLPVVGDWSGTTSAPAIAANGLLSSVATSAPLAQTTNVQPIVTTVGASSTAPATLTQANDVVSDVSAAAGEFTALGTIAPSLPIDSRAVDHLAGLVDPDALPAELMSGMLPAGVQRLPGVNEVDAVLTEPETF